MKISEDALPALPHPIHAQRFIGELFFQMVRSSFPLFIEQAHSKWPQLIDRIGHTCWVW